MVVELFTKASLKKENPPRFSFYFRSHSRFEYV